MNADGNEAQMQNIADRVALNAITKFAHMHPELMPKPEVPAPLKWAGAIVAALLTIAVGGTATWVVASINSIQVTLARMDERLINQNTSQGKDFAALEARVLKLENQYARGTIDNGT